MVDSDEVPELKDQIRSYMLGVEGTGTRVVYTRTVVYDPASDAAAGNRGLVPLDVERRMWGPHRADGGISR
jgi:hypothetical protein